MMYGGSQANHVPSMAQYSNLSDEMSNLHLSPGSKQAPTVPPKPRKPHEISPRGYGNIPRESSGQNSGDYYAVNAPTPGMVGMASACIKPQSADCDQVIPGKPSRTDSRMYHPDMKAPAHYTPPPPQPAHSYTPVSKMAVHMGAPQPLYSNTALKPQQQQQMYSSRQQALYSNMNAGHYNPQMHYAAGNHHDGSTGAYSSYGADSDFPLPPPEVLPSEYPPPAPSSPVSSAYSELRRTNQQTRGHHPQASGQHPGNGTYAPASHASTAYESIYEPISPRPASQMSTRSGGYGPVYGTAGQYAAAAVAPARQPVNLSGKEAEVDALTNMLVQSMESSGDPEFFGICARCGGKVVGEGSGCTAMEQVFHIRCFDCIVCHLQLQGKPFYAVDSKPYCEECYLNTLEKCCVCAKPILDRILRATGKPYHPGCFTCVVCSKALDGIPFTVDAANQIHCIDDFHKKFAPRCSVCHEPIMPEPGLEETVRVVALDRSFHINCYKCEDCGLLLSSEAEGRGCYPLDGHVLCKACNAARVQDLTNTLK